MYYESHITDCLTECQVDFIRNLLNTSYEAYKIYYASDSTHTDKANSVKTVEWVKSALYGYIEGLYHGESVTRIERNALMGKYVLDNRIFNDESLKNFKFLRTFS